MKRSRVQPVLCHKSASPGEGVTSGKMEYKNGSRRASFVLGHVGLKKEFGDRQKRAKLLPLPLFRLLDFEPRPIHRPETHARAKRLSRSPEPRCRTSWMTPENQAIARSSALQEAFCLMCSSPRTTTQVLGAGFSTKKGEGLPTILGCFLL